MLYIGTDQAILHYTDRSALQRACLWRTELCTVYGNPGNYLEPHYEMVLICFRLFVYLAEAVCLYIPFGYYICAYFLKWNYIFRLFLYLAFPAAMEISQAVSGLGRGQIDDYTLALLGILIGTLLFHAMKAFPFVCRTQHSIPKKSDQLKPLY